MVLRKNIQNAELCNAKFQYFTPAYFYIMRYIIYRRLFSLCPFTFIFLRQHFSQCFMTKSIAFNQHQQSVSSKLSLSTFHFCSFTCLVLSPVTKFKLNVLENDHRHPFKQRGIFMGFGATLFIVGNNLCLYTFSIVVIIVFLCVIYPQTLVSFQCLTIYRRPRSSGYTIKRAWGENSKII